MPIVTRLTVYGAGEIILEAWRKGDNTVVLPLDVVRLMIDIHFGLGRAAISQASLDVTIACRACGCTHDLPCNDGGEPCGWHRPKDDLCSACAKIIAAP